jgi:hypothetical protein
MYIVIDRDDEIFKPVTYPTVKKDLYFISNYGTLINKNNNKIKKQHEDKDGYYKSIVMLINDSTYCIPIHRLVAWEFVTGYDENTKQTIVNHLDNNRKHNYYENLEWTTVKENTIYGYEHGNGKRGEKYYNNKHSEKLVREICLYLQQGLRNIEILNIYGYYSKKRSNGFYDLVRDLKRRKHWTHVSKDYKW